jgi:hypothetical protein|tara:strand:+ start:522 stop:788 length:267 start_codon:yes stop_codon:yes gene_type:complete
MFKNYLVIFLFLLLANCTAPGSAFLGPALTGATTKSVAQASLSFGTNQIIKQIHETSKKSKNEVKKIAKKIEDFEIQSLNNKLFNFHR